MSRVEIASMPWGVVQDRSGNAIQSASVTLKNLDGSPATHYSAASGGSSSTAAISSDVNGTLSGRFIDGGQYLWSSATVSVIDRRVDAVSGSVESDIAGRPLNVLTAGVDRAGLVDQTTAMNAALAVPNRAVEIPAGTYIVEGLAPASGVTILAHRGAKFLLKTGSTQNCIQVPDASTDVLIDGIEIDGNASGVASSNVGISLGGIRNRVTNTYVHDTEYDGISVSSDSAHCTVDHCQVINTGRYCITVQGSTGHAATHVLIQGNQVKSSGVLTAAAALSVAGIGSYVTFADNVIESSNEDGIAGYNASNDHLAAIGNTIKNPGNHGIHLGGQDLAITGNVIQGPVLGHGIMVFSQSGVASSGFSVTGNVIRGTVAGMGIYTSGFSDGTIAGNNVAAPNSNCIQVEDGSNVTVAGNSCKGSVVGSGIRFAGVTHSTISGNTSRSNAQRGVHITDGTAIAASTNVTITGNTITGNTGNGILTSGSTTNVMIASNTMASNTAGNFSLANSTSHVVEVNFVDDSATVASAAALPLPLGLRFFDISGTATVTSITAASKAKGRMVVLKFQSGATITDGGSLVLAGSATNFVATSNDTLTLCCDGTDWYQVASSVN